MDRFTVGPGSFLLACLLANGPATQTPPRPTPGDPGPGVVKTALMSFTEYFCFMTEQSTPFAYIGFAFQIDGRIRYFKTSKTTCQNLKVSDPGRPDEPPPGPVFGEQVTLEEGKVPTRLRRENGDVYDIEPSKESTTRNYFQPEIVLTGSENPKYLGKNPHPDHIVRECRLLTDLPERDLCLWYQAGLQNDESICGELTTVRAEKCRAWIANIRSGRVNS